jgi:hypothetical protein
MSEQLHNIRNQQRKHREERISEDSRDRLKKIAGKKFQTCFVFPLSEFEKTFGLEVWGHGLPDNELTPAQRANKERWDQVRTAILNNGNTQARALDAEIDLHEVKFVGYHMDLVGGKIYEG